LNALCSVIVAEGRIPDDWKYVLLLVCKEKGDPMECEYSIVKLLEHAMKVIESVFERRINVNSVLHL